MRPIHIPDGVFRAALALLAVTELLFAGFSFFHSATLPTDENTFIDSPSRIEFASAFHAALLESKPYKGGNEFSGTPAIGDSLQRRDLLLAIEKSPVRTMESLSRTFAGLTKDSVTINVLRPSILSTIRWNVRRSDLLKASFVESRQGVIVRDVEPGGASDRAGMRVGDFIVRINGVGFSTATEADYVMRQGTSGKVNSYDVLRDGSPLTLNVVLAKFGFGLGTLMLLLAGVIFILVGSFIGLKRPQFLSARLLSLWIVSLGFVIAVWVIQREPSLTPFVVARSILLIYALYLGTVFGFHATLVFPWQRQATVWRMRVLVLMYALAAISPVLLFTWNRGLILTVFTVMPVLGLLINPPGSREGTPQQRALGRPIKVVTGLTIFGSLFTAICLNILGYGNLVGIVGLFLAFIPLAYLYTIGHYRLLDLELRIRRNVQYSLFSWLWGGLVVAMVIWTFRVVPSLTLPLPHVVLNGFSIEVREEPFTAAEGLIAQRSVAMILGVCVFLLLWKVRRIGQKMIDRKYHRTQFDYKRAAVQISAVLATKLSMNDLAGGVVQAMMDLLKIRSAGLLVFRDGGICCCDAASGEASGQWSTFAGGLDARIVGVLSLTREPLPADHLPPDLAKALDEMKFDYVIPILSQGTLSGAILAGQKLSETPYSMEDLSFLGGVAQQVSVSIENAFLYEGLAEQERMRHELSIARKIQLESLPAVTPRIDGLDIAGCSVPAMEVGGDFFDYLDGTGKELMIVVGDVSGKGTSAALYMSKVQGVLRSLHQFDVSPHELFLRANRLLCADLHKNSFVTATAALFLPRQQEVKLVRAGHLPVFMYRLSSQNVERLVPRGLGLGLNDTAIFASELEERSLKYESGDVLALVTDGVTETRDPEGEEYGEERLTRVLASSAHLTAEEIRDRLIADLSAFDGGDDPHDDRTVVVIRVL